MKKLRALRGQPDNANVINNATLLNDLDSIRLLFNEKEKELAMAVTKVDELTAQLEELRSGKVNLNYPPSSGGAGEAEARAGIPQTAE